MRALNRFFARLRNFAARRGGDERLREEMEQHVALQTEENLRAGMPPSEARRQALLKLGAVQAAREQYHAEEGLPLLENLLQDTRYALRQLRRSPGFTIVALLTLALGIGANTAMLSLVEGILLRPLPYQHPDRLVVVWQSTPEHSATGAFFNYYREFQAWQQNSRSFERLAALSWATGMPAGPAFWRGKPVHMLTFPVSLEFFSTLGEAATIGRTFAPGDLSGPCTLVLAHGFWQNRIGAPANLMSQSLQLGDMTCRVVGVMPRSFSFYPPQTDAWMLITPASVFATKPWDAMTGVFGLLKPGVTRAAAAAELAAIQSRILPEAPKDYAFMRNWAPDVISLHDNFTWLTGRNLRRGLWLLLGASTLILLIACLNIGNLLLGRGIERSRELAVRAALGAGRARLIRQLLTESLLLTIGGTAAGMAIAMGVLRWFRAASPIQLPPGAVISVDWHVFLFTLAAAAISMLAFATHPARQGSRTDPNTALKAGGPAQSHTASAQKRMQSLVVLQVALSMILLATAGLLAKSLWNFVSADLGYRADHVFTAQVSLPKDRYAHEGDLSLLTTQLSASLASLHQVRSVAFASRYLPLGASSTLSIDGRPQLEKAPSATEQDVSPDYFSTLGIPLLRGRNFDDRDRKKTQPVALINEVLAKKYFPGIDPLGHAIRLGSGADRPGPWLTIVGVVGNVKTTQVFQEMGYVEEPVVCRPLAQTAPSSLALMMATEGQPINLAGDVQRRLSQIDRELVLVDIDGLRSLRAGDLSQPRFRTLLFGGFAMLALLLALVGLYGVLAQMVLRRLHDIGIRMALGADRARILRSILAQACTISAIGIGLGTLGALAAIRLLHGLLYEIQAGGAIEFALAAGAMLAVAVLTAWWPAQRAASADPIRILRAE